MKTKTRTTIRLATTLSAVLSFGPFVAHSASGQDETPYPTPPQPVDVPITGDVYRYTVQPSPLQGGLDIPSPPVAVGFQAIPDYDTNRFVPPDTHGAVSPNFALTMLNEHVRVQTRTGTNLFGPVSLSNWWATAGTFTTIFDPKVLYDPYADRWIATVLTDPQAAGSSLLLATSQTGNPTNAWNFIKLDADPNNVVWADYPSIGFNRQWITVSVNMFTNSNNRFRNARLYVFNRTNVYAGGTNFVVINAETNNNAFTLAPAITYDTNQTTLYLTHWHIGLRTNELEQTEGLIRLRTLTGAVNSPVLSTNEVFAAYTPWALSPDPVVNFAPQSNSTVKIRINDARIQQVVYRNGSVWATHTILLPATNPTRGAVQWWQLATNGLVRQVGRIDDDAGVNFYAFPSIAVNQFNDVLLGFSSFSTNQYASASYSFRAYYDPDGEFRLPAFLKAGEDVYWRNRSTGNRWGDYSATQTDPVDDASFWTIQEYALPHVGTLTNESGRWATWWGQVAVTNPANDSFTNSFPLTGAQGNTNGTVLRATRETGEPNHVSASIGSVWYHWTAPTNGPVVFDTLGSTSGLDTLLAVYTGTSVGNLTVVATNDDANGTLQSQVTFTASSGTTYRIAVDAIQRVSDTASAFNLAWIQPQAPVITSQPQSTNVIAGNSATFAVSAIGVPTPEYRWRKNGTNIAGATNSSYSITSVATNDAGTYSVVVTNSAGSVTSSGAVLGVYHSVTATLSSYAATTNSFTFTVTGVAGYSYVIEATTDFSAWTSVATNLSPFSYTNMMSTNFPYRFFRAKY
jgi:hypothetical protein